ncbi:MAG: molecular chaperone Hsp33 [Alphaproteobacteria bacterium]|nr:molecular chaperone Hsp33 [Alphaproteobacteria bacterium]
MTPPDDDCAATFSVEGAPLRGRIARLGPGALDPILKRHDYPWPVALLLGEALALAALVGALLKAEGRFVVQAQGAGPVNLLVAEYRSDGGLRGYARIADRAALSSVRMTPRALLGEAALVMTHDRGDDGPSHQGVVALHGETLAAAAEHYFLHSEQTPTRVALAVAQVLEAGAQTWRAGGALMQRIAGDAARGDTQDAWERAEILFGTLRDEELVDPALPADRVLYRLFHEDGVRMTTPSALSDRCTCDKERLTAVLRSFSGDELADLVEPDGFMHARCEFCARTYRIPPAEIAPRFFT